MSPSESPTEFERRTQAVLEESVTRVDARVRSRLNQARHAALEEIASRPRSFWRYPVFMPATGALAAAAVVALVLTTHHGAERSFPVSDGGQSAYEDIELLADTEGLDLIEGEDNRFYEWAAAQSDDGDGTSG
ncbi:MAG: hypothetical protein ABI885_22185 [Gammaproteobacteria bacterium]